MCIRDRSYTDCHPQLPAAYPKRFSMFFRGLRLTMSERGWEGIQKYYKYFTKLPCCSRRKAALGLSDLFSALVAAPSLTHTSLHSVQSVSSLSGPRPVRQVLGEASGRRHVVRTWTGIGPGGTGSEGKELRPTYRGPMRWFGSSVLTRSHRTSKR